MKLADILDVDALNAQVADGFIRIRWNADHTLAIYNYSEKVQYTRAWTHEAQVCRGLIADSEGNIVARPWPKFFNYGEFEIPTHLLMSPVEVTDKMDGSLGIVFYHEDVWQIATRGSFESDQAFHGQRVLNYYLHHGWTPDPAYTYLFEIVYPDNRIVLDYGGKDDLFLLGAVHTDTGATLGPVEAQQSTEVHWLGPVTKVFPAQTFAEALALPPRENAEGIVVRFLSNNEAVKMVKIKQEDYVALHRIVTGLNARTVWAHLAANDNKYDDLLESLPDEFHAWTIDVAESLLDQYEELWSRVNLVGTEILSRIDPLNKKEFAMEAAKYPDIRSLLFMFYDGKTPCEAIWKRLKPEGNIKLINQTEDEA